MFMTQNNAFRFKIMPVEPGIISCCPLSPSGEPVLCHRESLCRFWLSPLPALARHQACTPATRQVEVFATAASTSASLQPHTLLATFAAFNRHTTSKNHGENDSHCQRSAMLIHPSGKLFNPQKSKAKDRSARNHNPCSRLTARLNAQPSRRGSTEP